MTSRSRPSSGQQLDRLFEPHRKCAGPLVEELVRAVDARVEHPEAARAGGKDGLEADRPVRVTELARRGVDAGGAGHAAKLGRTRADAVQRFERLGLVVRAAYRLRSADHDRHRELAPPKRQMLQVVRRLGEHDVARLPARRARAARRGRTGRRRAGRRGTHRTGGARSRARTCPRPPGGPRARRCPSARAGGAPRPGAPQAVTRIVVTPARAPTGTSPSLRAPRRRRPRRAR